jgi:hypothetical protein
VSTANSSFEDAADRLLMATRLAQNATLASRQAQRDLRKEVQEQRDLFAADRRQAKEEMQKFATATLETVTSVIERALEKYQADMIALTNEMVEEVVSRASQRIDEGHLNVTKAGGLMSVDLPSSSKPPRASRPEYRGDEETCDSCGGLFDAATNVAGDWGSPKAGDISLCARCGNIAIFTGIKLQRRPATEVEKGKALADQATLAAVTMIKHKAAVRGKQGRRKNGRAYGTRG